jgi:hypothetical protein
MEDAAARMQKTRIDLEAAIVTMLSSLLGKSNSKKPAAIRRQRQELRA